MRARVGVCAFFRVTVKLYLPETIIACDTGLCLQTYVGWMFRFPIDIAARLVDLACSFSVGEWLMGWSSIQTRFRNFVTPGSVDRVHRQKSSKRSSRP